MKKLFIIFSILLLSFVVGCDKKITITSIEVTGLHGKFDENFCLSDLNVEVQYSDDSTEIIPLDSAMISKEDLHKFNQFGTHTINVMYLNTSSSFTITIVVI